MMCFGCKNKFVVTALLHLSKAFECIPYGLIISKMKAYDLDNNALIYMVCYLSDMYQTDNSENFTGGRGFLIFASKF